MKVPKRMMMILLAAVLLQHPVPVSAQDTQGRAEWKETEEAQGTYDGGSEAELQGTVSELPGTGNADPQDVPESWTSENRTAEEDAGTDPQTKGTVRLMIDNQNRYEGMEKTYSEGYIPKAENGTVYLVMPIISSGRLKDDTLRVSLDLGDVKTMPFVCKNYVKSISLKQVKVNDGKETAECYLASFALELKEDRYNGSYPVVLAAKAADENGNVIEKDFTLYVTITDGKNLKEETTEQNGEKTDGQASDGNAAENAGDAGTAVEAAADMQASPQADDPDFAPKVVIQSCQFSKETIQAGDEVKTDIILFNTSQSEPIRNLTVTISGNGEYFRLMSPSDTIYIDSIPAGTTSVVSYLYEVSVSAPQGQYDLEVTMDYADSSGTSYTGGGKVQVPVEQPVRLEFDPLSIPSEVTVADVVEVQVQAMNLGKGTVCNVRAVLEADGLSPAGTIFIGDMKAGTTGSGTTQVSVSGLSGGTSLYGKTEGTVTFYYEDEAGKEYEETAVFTTTIASPFTDPGGETEEETGQWWVIMAAIGMILCMFLLFFVIRGIRRRKQTDEMVE